MSPVRNAPRHPGHQQHQERIEAVAPAAGIDIGKRVESGGQRDQRGAEIEDRAGQIDAEGDAEGRQPAAHHHGLRPLRRHPHEQGGIDEHQQPERHDGQKRLGGQPAAQHDQRCARRKANHQRQHDQPVAGAGGDEDGGWIEAFGLERHDLNIPSAAWLRSPARRNAFHACRRSSVPGRRDRPAPGRRRRRKRK